MKGFHETLLSDEKDEKKGNKNSAFYNVKVIKYIFLELENKKNSRNVFRDYWNFIYYIFSMSLTFLHSPMTELCFHKVCVHMRKRCVKQ